MKRTIFGIKQCDTVRRALKDLQQAGIEHRFHDFRVDGLDRSTVRAWVDALGLDTVLNRRGTTWRQVSDQLPDNADDDALIDLIVTHPTLVKRPVFDRGDHYRIGYPAKSAEATLNWFVAAG